MDGNRIERTSIAPTVPRQTPRDEFGARLAQATGQGIRQAAILAGGAVGLGPVLSAAVSSSPAAPGVARAGLGSGMPSSPSAGGLGIAGLGNSWDLLQVQADIQNEGQQFNAAYLQLQDAMQRESREFNAISNIIKVRHDSAKSAINNIR